ncbi:poly-beta-1,6-N-acetyl-D-glucosamine N-deacetylase PgaB,Polysaccharide deacetylase [Chlamydia serpentis]|uniref:Poly-beta-1,6-N-acetyl-D-glucosamine N-deacetylase PgaB,Polysaccharide deacetylase n=2 Tax=Chlamydia serpentis TaxID=1967782 RepID=A0A2R8FBW5_9CHLA|nr:poly-beta-1,6-N-acetyl-D-glucosamine N-deacetylase PgaB,Polysaccharide deacetylase [Chlamydia serpentis]
MLTFDFASFDFYANVFPFLQQQGIPAVVGVASRYIPSNTAQKLNPSYRLKPSETLAFQDEIFSNHMPFCCQNELLEMAESPYIQLASSGFAIRNLLHNPPYLTTEILLSRNHLENITGEKPASFLFPFGKSDSISRKLVADYYPYSFLLGNTINRNSKTHNIYRLDIKPMQYIRPTLLQSSRYLKNWIKEKSKQLYLEKLAKNQAEGSSNT